MELETQAAFDPASFEHIPVLLNECLEGLAIDPAGTYLDGTAGGAGHSRQIALRLDEEMTADRDFFCCILRQKREHKPLQSGA